MSSGGDNGAAGGTTGSGGGSSATGGTANTGGSNSSGGAPGGAGTMGTGAMMGSGGARSGGAPGSGGAAMTGGAPGSGGAATTGGAPGTGGAATTGGAPGSGGAATTGGAPGTGGAATTGGAPGTGGATAGTGGATSACAAPTVRITEIDVGATINTNEDDAANKPLMIAAIPAGGSRVLWYGADGKAHVTTLKADDTVNANAGTVAMGGESAADLYADNNGGVVLVARDAKGGGTLNCGNPANLCGTPPTPAIPCYDMYMVRFDGTTETWATQLTQSSATHPPYLNSATDSSNVVFIWWYAHQGRIVSDGTNYAGYFGSALSVSQGGCVNVHQGDTLSVVSPTGTLLTGHNSFAWGCSHSGYERIVWDSSAGKFVGVCKNDTQTNGKSGQIVYASAFPWVTMAPIDLWYGNLGNIILGGAGKGGYWLTASDMRVGQTPNADGLADVHLYHFTNAGPDIDKTIAGTAGRNDRAPHLAKYGANMLAVWEESTATGDLAFKSTARTMFLQVLDSGTGAVISQPITVASTGANAIYGSRYGEFKAFPDGSVAYASAGGGATKVRILRVMPCQ